MNATTDPIDHQALRLKYRQERDKRLRPDGNEQYVQPTGKFACLLDDPYTPHTERAPLRDEVTVALIGGGFASLITGARLKEAGVDDVRIIEGGGDVGGTWYWNRYPGAMCDTAAMIYLPLLEETGYRPSMKYVFAPEIHGQARRIAGQYGLYDNALFSTQVTGLAWEEETSRWVIRTDRNDEIRARFVAMGTGPLHRPKLPGIPGIETFAGHSFHTSRWDYAYTGGNPEGAPMEKLSDKRVGIIGTGATAVQCIPPLARDAGELFVFQRTPSSIDVRNNHAIDPEEFAKLSPGWQRQWVFNFATLQTGGFADEDYVKDGWTDIAKRIRDRVVSELTQSGGELTPELIARAYTDSDDEKMEEIRARVDEIVQDAATAAGLKPWYQQLCKRPCFHDEYLAGVQRAHLPPHRHRRQGRGAHRRDRCVGRWQALRARLPDLRLRLRGRHRLRPARRLRDHWARRRDALRALVGRHADAARHARARLPEPVHPRHDPGRQPHLEHHQQPRRGRYVGGRGGGARPPGRRRTGGGDRRGRAGVGRHDRELEPVVPRESRMHARLLQQRGPPNRPPRETQRGGLPGRAGSLLRVH
jgi:cation diffusion facilitator CzcD-associated flavoprotein CzcO